MMWAACVLLTAHALVPPPRRIARSPARRAQSAAADAAEKTWRSRRRLARAAFDARCAWDRAAAQAELEQEDEEDLDVVQSTVSTTARSSARVCGSRRTKIRSFSRSRGRP